MSSQNIKKNIEEMEITFEFHLSHEIPQLPQDLLVASGLKVLFQNASPYPSFPAVTDSDLIISFVNYT